MIPPELLATLDLSQLRDIALNHYIPLNGKETAKDLVMMISKHSPKEKKWENGSKTWTTTKKPLSPPNAYLQKPWRMSSSGSKPYKPLSPKKSMWSKSPKLPSRPLSPPNPYLRRPWSMSSNGTKTYKPLSPKKNGWPKPMSPPKSPRSPWRNAKDMMDADDDLYE